jgi:hypothetical protein
MKRRLALHSNTIFLVLAAVLGGISGCGTPGAPQPPSLHLPKPIEDLRAERVGDKVYLSWTAPAETTDGEGIRSAGTVEVCRVVSDTGPSGGVPGCRDKAGDLALPPSNTQADRRQTFVDDISSRVNGSQDFLTYNVVAENNRGKAAGTSNPVVVFLAPSVPAVRDVQVKVERDAVRLEWTPVDGAEPMALRVENRYVVRRKGVDGEQTFPISGSASSYADTNFDWGKTYEYVVQGVTRVLSRDGSKTLAEIEGEPSQQVTVTPKDVFPPATPEGLQAVYTSGFVDLTWRAVEETDIVGYNVYRVLANAQPQKLNEQPVVASAFRDEKLAGVAAGTELTYFVTAVDGRGNESERSERAMETVPKE